MAQNYGRFFVENFSTGQKITDLLHCFEGKEVL